LVISFFTCRDGLRLMAGLFWDIGERAAKAA
jgi:hypothetical protein